MAATSLLLRQELSGLPTQTVLTRSGVQPTVQLSRKNSAVPVLALTRRSGRVRSPWAPKSITRLASLLVISLMMKATFSGTTRLAVASGLSVKMALPVARSTMWSTGLGSWCTPRSAMVAAPSASSSGVTGKPPSVAE